jgi:hypothetical protein
MRSSEVKDVVDDNITEVANAIVEAYDSGELQAAIDGGHDAWSKWIKGMGKGITPPDCQFTYALFCPDLI